MEADFIRKGFGKWSKAGVPKKQWACVDVDDVGPDSTTTREMCCSASIRFVHVMRHNDYPDALRCGCVCAGNMAADLVGARSREKKLRLRAGRRSSFSTLKRWRRSQKGNAYISLPKDRRVTVFKKAGKYSFVVEKGSRKAFSKLSFTTELEAKLAAFDKLEDGV
jgi:hypothetical protein